MKHQNFFIYVTASFLNVPIYILTKSYPEAQTWCWHYFPSLCRDKESGKGNFICNVKETSYVTLALVNGNYYVVNSNDRKQKAPTAAGLIGMVLTEVSSRLKKMDYRNIGVPLELLNQCKMGQIFAHKPAVLEQLSRQTTLVLHNVLQQEGLEVPGNHHRLETEKLVRICLLQCEYFGVFYKVVVKSGCLGIFKTLAGDLFSDLVTKHTELNILHLVEEIEDNLVRRIPVSTTAFEDMDDELTKRRETTNKVVIGSSVTGMVGGVIGVVGLCLIPVTFGTSVILTITGSVIGGLSGVASAGVRIHEAVEQNKRVKTAKPHIEQEHSRDIELANLMETLQNLCTNFEAFGDLKANSPGISLRGFMAVGSFLRSSHTAVSVALVAAKVSSTALTAVSAVLAPASIILDGAYLAEAAYNLKKKQSKTNAGEMLKDLAEHCERRNIVSHSMLRGNIEGRERVFKGSSLSLNILEERVKT